MNAALAKKLRYVRTLLELLDESKTLNDFDIDALFDCLRRLSPEGSTQSLAAIARFVAQGNAVEFEAGIEEIFRNLDEAIRLAEVPNE